MKVVKFLFHRQNFVLLIFGKEVFNTGSLWLVVSRLYDGRLYELDSSQERTALREFHCAFGLKDLSFVVWMCAVTHF